MSNEQLTPRMCPICERMLDDAFCDEHMVPTVRASSAPDGLGSLKRGTILAGRYRVESLIKRGGMGTILLATQLSMGRVVAIKLLHDDLRGDRTSIKRFYQEARLAAGLEHTNIVRIFELGFDDELERPFIVMEYLKGETLSELVRRQGPLEEEAAKRLLAQVARALRAAHRAGIVHRDLSPANIMINAEPDGDHVRVLDFGLAKAAFGAQQALTEPGFSVGTPMYMSPEQVLSAEITPASDLYSLGCVLHFVLTGNAPFVDGRAPEILYCHVNVPPPPLPERLAGGEAPSGALVELVSGLLAKEPAGRPSIEEVLQALGSDTSGRVPVVAAVRTPPPPARTKVEPTRTDNSVVPNMASLLRAALPTQPMQKRGGEDATELDARLGLISPAMPPPELTPLLQRTPVLRARSRRRTIETTVAFVMSFLAVAALAYLRWIGER